MAADAKESTPGKNPRGARKKWTPEANLALLHFYYPPTQIKGMTELVFAAHVKGEIDDAAIERGVEAGVLFKVVGAKYVQDKLIAILAAARNDKCAKKKCQRDVHSPETGLECTFHWLKARLSSYGPASDQLAAEVTAKYHVWVEAGRHCAWSNIYVTDAEMDLDHVVPRSTDASLALSAGNLVFCHAAVNSMKSDRPPMEFWALLKEIASSVTGSEFTPPGGVLASVEEGAVDEGLAGAFAANLVLREGSS